MKVFYHRFVLLRALMLLCLQNEALAQVRKIKVCTPGAGTGSMHIYAPKISVTSLRKDWMSMCW
jgi:hypothetical protein